LKWIFCIFGRNYSAKFGGKHGNICVPLPLSSSAAGKNEWSYAYISLYALKAFVRKTLQLIFNLQKSDFFV
jgi:hypothetical protein